MKTHRVLSVTTTTAGKARVRGGKLHTQGVSPIRFQESRQNRAEANLAQRESPSHVFVHRKTMGTLTKHTKRTSHCALNDI